MPWKPPPQPTCARCTKAVYPTEKLDCLDKTWHKACFSCKICGLKLTMNTYKGYEKEAYCKTHYPHQTATAVADTPETLRLKKQTERQSAVAYHKNYENEKGKYTAVASDPELERVKKNQAVTGHSYDQRGEDAEAPAASYEAAAAAAPEPAYEPEPEPAYEPEPEPEAEPEPEPEPEPAYEPEPEPEPAYEPEPEAAAPAAGGGNYKALYDYDAADEDEVSFVEGDIITNVSEVAEGWMSGTVERTGASGMLPSNYVEPC